ncbi:hypothetical protein BDP27DRAFT_1370408 [Rhodocollybia butyracea]|uniref:Uncharacterized protein n=1 Tax=Rhodocollybia butyracea TaxID=206335 RepID=A0A9P5TZP9_9AGAR|nr:hypothetical protein BDP27DRAFT_1370408 [Rhodocollybia butyracea]
MNYLDVNFLTLALFRVTPKASIEEHYIGFYDLGVAKENTNDGNVAENTETNETVIIQVPSMKAFPAKVSKYTGRRLVMPFLSLQETHGCRLLHHTVQKAVAANASGLNSHFVDTKSKEDALAGMAGRLLRFSRYSVSKSSVYNKNPTSYVIPNGNSLEALSQSLYILLRL